jgi:4-amino-4-deoxy-L-arabinose transferase-like glycosyltransferase
MLRKYATTMREIGQQGNTTLSGKSLLSIAAAALLIRVACMFFLQSWEFEQEWQFGHEMGRIGQWLAQGKGFSLDGISPTAKFPPLYPLLVGGAFSIFGTYTQNAAIALFVFQSLCSAVIAVCLAKLAGHLFGRTSGIIAGLMWAFYPTSIFYSALRIWYCELALLFLVLLTMIAVTAGELVSFRRLALLGALSGLTILTDSTLALYLPLLLLWMLIARRVQLPRFVVSCVIWGITAAAVISPWMLRNRLMMGSGQPLKSNLGLELFTGNSSFSTGTNDRAAAERTFAALDQKELAFYKSQPEVVYYGYLRERAIDWIREHPLDFLLLTVRRVWYFWVFNPSLGWESWIRLSYFGPFLILALYRVSCDFRRWRELAPLWVFLLIYPLPYYLTHVARGRYSYPVEPFVVLLAAVPLAVWSARYRASSAAAPTTWKAKVQAKNI